MKAVPFESTSAFQHFKHVMRNLLKVPKAEVDELVRMAKENSPRNNNKNAPGRKRTKKRRNAKPADQ